jgi:anti-sigma regulatory factor (Ser/Thr protein kinase)
VIKRVVVALYEAEVNIVAHAYRGVIYADIQPGGIILRLVDEGPGIPDVEMAMTKGF